MGIRMPNERGDLGKYDAIADMALREAQAPLVALLVIQGHQGSGFSVATVDPNLQRMLPDMLEHMAKDIRAKLQGAQDS